MECELINILNEKTENRYEFSLKSAVLERNADFCVIEIYYKDGVLLDSDKRKEIESVMLGIVPQNFKYQLKFVKKFVNEERVKEEAKLYMKKNFPSVTFNLEKVDLEGKKFCILLSIDSLSFEHVLKINLKKQLSDFFKNQYRDFDFDCEISENSLYREDTDKKLIENYKEDDVDILAPRKIEVAEKEVYIGDPIEGQASYIKDKEKLDEIAVFCGKIKGIKKYVYEIKAKEKDEEAEAKEEDIAENKDAESSNLDSEAEKDKKDKPRERTVFRWTLAGFTGNLPCVCNATKQTKTKLEMLEDGASVIVCGKLEMSKFSGELQLHVKDISTCTLPEKFEEKIVYRQEKPFYEWVKPEKYISYKQDDLLSFMQEEVVAPHLKNKTFVCYDLETTGVHFESGDRMIEIGAVKIENGKITESFSTLINPERSIPIGASKVNNIYDKDVANAIKADQALQDFYKFTRGAILVGYNNISFDNIFLVGQGKECRWNFDNETEDVYPLAQKFVFGVKNYKLITIAEKLGIALDNAHRALFDTIATAEVFIKLASHLDN